MSSNIVRAETLEELRNQFKAEENRIVQYYDELSRQPGVDKNQAANLMKKALIDNRKNYSASAGKDSRYTQAEVQKAFEGGKISEISPNKTGPGYIDEINAKLAEKGLKLKSTGGSADLTPSHINADIDTVIVHADGSPATPAEQVEGIRILEERGLSQGDAMRQNNARFDNKGKDLTAWKPDSPEAQADKLNDSDSFKSEGGRHATRNPGALQDAHGGVLDDQAKFESARAKGDLKTQGKSLFKAGTGEASGIKVIEIDEKTGKEKVVRKSTFKEKNPELYEKAKTLKEYGTTHEAGITEAGNSPEAKQGKIGEFQGEMANEMDALEKEGARKGKLRDNVRENFQGSYDKAGAKNSREGVADKYKTDAELNSERAKGIQDERGRVQKSNQQVIDAIDKEKARPTSKDTFTGGRKGPGDAGFGEQHPAADAPETTVIGKAKNALARLNEMEAHMAGVSELPAGASGPRVNLNAGAENAMGFMAVAGTAYESGTIAAKLSKARILYEAAAKEKDDAMAKSYFEQAEKLEQGAIDQLKSAVLVTGATIVSPIFVGGALVGMGAYHGTRAVLENTETGKAIDAGVRGGMTSVIEGARDAATIASGQQTYDEIAEGTLTARQSTWIEALRKEEIELEEGATVRDVLTLVERNQDKIANFQNLGYLKGVVRVKGSHPDDTEDKQNSGEDDLNNLLAKLGSMKTAMDALDGQARALNDQAQGINDTFQNELKSLNKTIDAEQKAIVAVEKDLSKLSSIANKVNDRLALAQKDASDAYRAGEAAAAARGGAEQATLKGCQASESIKSMEDIPTLENLIQEVRSQGSPLMTSKDNFNRELKTARLASEDADRILKEYSGAKSLREEIRTKLQERENVMLALNSDKERLNAHIASEADLSGQIAGVKGAAAGIVSQAEAAVPAKLKGDEKKILNQIKTGLSHIEKDAQQAAKVESNLKGKLDMPSGKIEAHAKKIQEVKTNFETAAAGQISDEVIVNMEKLANDAKASLDTADVFSGAMQVASDNYQTCLNAAESLYNRKTSPEAQVARTDCSGWPGTAAVWNAAKKSPECQCTQGNLWDEKLNTCVAEEQYYMARIDCSGYFNSEPQWNASARQAQCFCIQGYEWNNGRNACRVDARTQIAQADCRGYPGTVPAWNNGAEQVNCNCPDGYQWNGSQCVPQQPAFDPNQLINAIQQVRGASNSGGNSGGGNGNNAGGNTWGGGTTQQAQGDPCATNFYLDMGGAVCQCSGYTFNSSQNQCVPGGRSGNGSASSGDNGGTPAGFTGWGGETGGESTSGGSTGGVTTTNSGGVSTSPGTSPCVYTGGVNTCEP